jgi:hypothetical protein
MDPRSNPLVITLSIWAGYGYYPPDRPPDLFDALEGMLLLLQLLVAEALDDPQKVKSGVLTMKDKHNG